MCIKQSSHERVSGIRKENGGKPENENVRLPFSPPTRPMAAKLQHVVQVGLLFTCAKREPLSRLLCREMKLFTMFN